MKLMPASSARWMIAIDLSWSVSPQAPNIIAPRQSGLTWTPVVPRLLISMPTTYTRPVLALRIAITPAAAVLMVGLAHGGQPVAGLVIVPILAVWLRRRLVGA